MKKIRTGLLAYGFSGKVFHSPFLESNPGFELYAVCERNNKNAIADYPQIISYASVDELLEDESIELVVVNTPNDLHYEHSLKALKSRKHVLVEKPFTATVAQAEELFTLAGEVGKKIFVYQNRRWDSDFMSLRDVVRSGTLGKLSEVHLRYDRYRPELSPKKFKETGSQASGLQYDLGPHLLDQAISLFGYPQTWNKFLGYNRDETKVDDYFFIQLSYEQGLNVTVASNLLAVDPLPSFVAHGSGGSYIKNRTDVQEQQLIDGIKPTDLIYGIEKHEGRGVLSCVEVDGSIIKKSVEAPKGDYSSLFNAVYQSIRNSESFPVTQEDILVQLSILES